MYAKASYKEMATHIRTTATMATKLCNKIEQVDIIELQP